MSGVRAGLNRALAAVTGYQLTRVGPQGSSEPDAASGEGEARATVDRTPPDTQAAPSKSKAAASNKGKSASSKRKFPADYDAEYRAIIKAVRPYTMASDEKLHALISATRYIHEHAVHGAVVECGVWRGGGMHTVARTLDYLGDHSRELYLFDTFEGMPEPTEEDVRYDGAAAADLLASKPYEARIWAYASLGDVKDGFAQVPYPAECVHYVQGPVEETVPEQAPEEIALLRLDTDWYVSTRHEFEYLYPKLVSGGVLFIDDFGWFQGSRQATEEFLERTGERLLLIRTASGRVAVKP